MIIYCDGDSYVAGSELGDILLPDHPGFVPIGIPKHIERERYNWTRRTYGNGDLSFMRRQLYNEIEKLEKEKAFPNKIAKKLNVEVINAAVGGSSMDSILRRTLSNLITLKDKDNIVAFISTTDPWRFELPTLNDTNSPWTCVTVDSKNEQVAEVFKYMVSANKNYHSLIRYYKNIISIQDFCKVNNIKLFFLDRNTTNQIESEFENYEDYINLKKYANFKVDLDMSQEKIRTIFKTENIICPGHHYNENVHEYIANELIKLL
jgi:hypothetical protein